MSYLRNLYQLNQLHFRQIKIEMERKMNENNESMIENESMKETTSSEDSDADMAECSNGYDEPLIDQGNYVLLQLFYNTNSVKFEVNDSEYFLCFDQNLTCSNLKSRMSEAER